MDVIKNKTKRNLPGLKLNISNSVFRKKYRLSTFRKTNTLFESSDPVSEKKIKDTGLKKTMKNKTLEMPFEFLGKWMNNLARN